MALILQKELKLSLPETVHNHDYMETKNKNGSFNMGGL